MSLPYWMHGSRVYKLYGMGNGCRGISRFVSDQFRQPCIIPLPKISMLIRTAKDFQPKIRRAFNNAVGICLKC